MASMAMLNNQTVPFADMDSMIWTYEQNPMLWDNPIAALKPDSHSQK